MALKHKRVGKNKKPPGNLLFFCLGLLTGTLLLIAIILLGSIKTNEGINIYVNGEKVLKIIAEKIENQLQEDFPGYIKEIKKAAPYIVEKYMHDFINIGNLEIGGYPVNLPPQFIKDLEKDLRSDVTAYVMQLLEEMEKEHFVEELSRNLTGDVIKTLLADLNGQVVRIPLVRDYSIPVVVWLY